MENQASGKPMLLVVEPDPLMLTGISAILDARGYRCFLSRDLSVAIRATETVAFDLFIVSFSDDVHQACEAANQLRQLNTTDDVPVVFLSDRLEDKWREPLNNAGGSFCLTKPYEPDTLIDLVDRALWMPQLARAKVNPPKTHLAQDWIKLS